MPRKFALIALTAQFAVPAAAAERTVAFTSFDRIRVEGPFEVRVVTGASPRAVVSGDARALDQVEVRVDADTLTVRAASTGWGEQAAARGVAAPVIRVQTRALRSAGVVGGGRLSIAGPVAADQVDLAVTGAGVLTAPGIAAGVLTATLIGTGGMTLGGSARTGRLVGNGAGRIAAQALTVGDVTVLTEGTAAVAVTGRFTATAYSAGIGPIEILGRPECKGRAQAGGTITCGGKPL